MKTTLISAIAFTLALASTPALAQDEPATSHEWFACYMNFAERHTRHVAVLEALARAVKEGKYKFDAETCFAKVEGDSSLAAAGEACLDIGNRVPKDSPDKKFINKINKQHLAQVKILQKGIAKFRPICEKLQGKEDAQKEESLTRAPLPPGHSRITTTITTITTTTTKEADAQRAP